MSAPRLPLRREFIARLDGARELGRRFFRGANAPGAPGAPPEEFESHRPYSPGDDVRWIDWNLYARQRELAVKVFRADEEIEVLLLLDASASMAAGGGAKLRAAGAAAAALARLALVTGHPVRLARYAGRLLDVGGPWRAADDIAAVQRRLAAPPPTDGDGTDLGQALDPLVSGRQRPLCLVALTDGFQAPPLISAATLALARGVRRMVLVRVLHPPDLAPVLRGLCVLRDPEGGGSRRLFADRALEAAARERIAEHFVRLGEGLRRLGVPLHALPVAAPFEAAFLSLLREAAAPAPRVA